MTALELSIWTNRALEITEEEQGQARFQQQYDEMSSEDQAFYRERQSNSQEHDATMRAFRGN